MTVKSLNDEDKLPIKQLIKAVNKKMDDVLRVVDALNLGRTEVKADGVYRTFNNGDIVKVAEGNFKKRRVSAKRIKLF
jgi:transcription antitermination factor NusG